MTLEEIYQFVDFWVNKVTGAFYTIPELTTVIDRGQMAYYSDNKPKYATSQLVKDILSPFKERWTFTPSDTISGVIVVPSNLNYLDLLDVQIEYGISGRTLYYGVPMVNEDERSFALNSQIDPVTVTSPIGEVLAPRYIRLYPSQGYSGIITFLRRPKAPVYAYTVISGRVIVFDEANSVNLEWRETEIIPVLLKALKHIGINLPDNAVDAFAEAKSQGNYLGINHT